jgi:hypothetical protein
MALVPLPYLPRDVVRMWSLHGRKLEQIGTGVVPSYFLPIDVGDPPLELRLVFLGRTIGDRFFELLPALVTDITYREEEVSCDLWFRVG